MLAGPSPEVIMVVVVTAVLVVAVVAVEAGVAAAVALVTVGAGVGLVLLSDASKDTARAGSVPVAGGWTVAAVLSASGAARMRGFVL